MTIWTPDGEHPINRDANDDTTNQAGDDGGINPDSATAEFLATLSDEDLATFTAMSDEDQANTIRMFAELSDARQRMMETPAATIVANHAMGLYELAAIHLSATEPNLAEAKLSIDALVALVDVLRGQSDTDESTLNDAVAQIQLAFVQVSAAVKSQADES